MSRQEKRFCIAAIIVYSAFNYIGYTCGNNMAIGITNVVNVIVGLYIFIDIEFISSLIMMLFSESEESKQERQRNEG
ncbi:MAG: hypothetical protein KAI26_04165 [Nanoarchaeota archaeon]|nr:hypothetical protein [Nanoarchaeota archaeon]